MLSAKRDSSSENALVKPEFDNPWARALVGTTSPSMSEAVKNIHAEGIADNTVKALRKDLRYFWGWVEVVYRLDAETYPVPVEVVERFISDHVKGLDFVTNHTMRQRGLKSAPGTHAISTIRRRISSLSTAHEAKGVGGDFNPCRAFRVRRLLQSAAKVVAKRGEQTRKKAASTLDVLEQLIQTCEGGTLIDLRDRAILAFGFATGGRRREEIANAIFENLDPMPEGFIFHLNRSKTDQKGKGEILPLFGIAAEYVTAWLVAANILAGPLFCQIDRHGNMRGALSPSAIAEIIKKRCAIAGLDPRIYGGHSLRSGFITSGGREGIPLSELTPLSTHKDERVAGGYHRAGNLINNRAAWLMDKKTREAK